MCSISAVLIPDDLRIQHTADLFSTYFPLRLEPTVFDAAHMAVEYNGGYWSFYALSNGGFYMAPNIDSRFNLHCPNSNEVELSADSLGIVCCLYAYSMLSFERVPRFSEVCAEQYHLLREFMFGHAEAASILRAID